MNRKGPNQRSDEEPEDRERNGKFDRGAKRRRWSSSFGKDTNKRPATRRRTRIPDRLNRKANLWNLMKNSIGKDLSKIPLPVSFCEPLSMLQRLVETFEYGNVLDAAASCSDPYERLAHVAAFSISTYSSTVLRVLKPFNPLLGETYECDRTDDLGWKAVAEQISHHPPTSVVHCQGNAGWTLFYDLTVDSKFRGKYLKITPVGTVHLMFEDGAGYTYNKVTTIVNNIILGTLWIDQMGDVEILERRSGGAKCKLTYYPYSNFRKDVQRSVKGTVEDAKGNVMWTVSGNWDSVVELKRRGKEEEEQQPLVGWQRQAPSKNSEKYYNFSLLACQLNEPEKGVAPTDSRNRPDLRQMEEGNWTEADMTKAALEQAQRLRAKDREERVAPPHRPVWFKYTASPLDKQIFCWQYNGGYWEAKKRRDWSMCPRLYTTGLESTHTVTSTMP